MNPNKPCPPKRRILSAVVIAFFLLAGDQAALATTFTVNVAIPGGGLAFEPFGVIIQPGDTVMWVWQDTPDSFHTVTSGTPTGGPTGLFDSGLHNKPFTFSFTFPTPGTFDYYCAPHGLCCGMVGRVIVVGSPPTPTPRPPSQAQLLNISTRADVKIGDNVLIGGFIVTGNVAKKVILRAIGPSLTSLGVAGALADPVLELHASGGSLISSNDNWRSDQEAEIIASTVPPTNDFESAIVATLDPGAYTAIVSGKNATSGVGLVEGYDLDQPADAQLANISTRGFVESGGNVMIGGFILGNGTGTTNILVRGLGPSLTAQGVNGALVDPTLELHDANGTIVATNDNWKDTQQAEIEGTGAAPTMDLESAIIATIPTAAYTAILAGKNSGTGVGLVEVYRLP